MEPEQISAYEKDGFVNLGVLFTREEMAAVRAALFCVLLAPPPGVAVIREEGSSAVRSVMGWERAGGILDKFSRDERVLGPVQAIFGDGVVLHQVKYNPKAGEGHGDKWDPHRGFTFWHFLDGVPRAEGMISVFIALTDQTLENGAVQTWKGAHRLSLEQLREETDFSARQGEEGDTATRLSLQMKEECIELCDQQFERVYLTGQAGTVWLLDSLNLHASGSNEDDEDRDLVADVFRAISNKPLHPRKSEFLCGTSNEPLVSWKGPLLD